MILAAMTAEAATISPAKYFISSNSNEQRVISAVVHRW
jgi:hypothetical protein